MDGKIRVKAITPYEGLRQLILKSAPRYPDYEISVEFGNITDCGPKVKRAIQEGYEVILSRGGTAQMIQENFEIPSVNIGVSGYDILRTMRLAQNYSGKKAILGFESITHGCRSICELLEEDMEIYTIQSFGEVREILEFLKDRGISTVIGDTITVNNAEKLGLTSILLTSGRESVQAALDQAGQYVRYIRAGRDRADFLERVMRQCPAAAAVYSEKSDLIFADKRLENASPLLEKLSELAEPASHGSEYFGVLSAGEQKRFRVTGKTLDQAEGTAAFFCQETEAQQMEGLGFLSPSELKKAPCGMFSTANQALRESMDRLRQLAKTGSPVLLEGEPGTGKDTLAAILCRTHSETSALIPIDCARIAPDVLREVLEGTHPYLLGLPEYTLHFRHFDRIGSEQQEELIRCWPRIRERFLIFSAETSIESRIGRGNFQDTLYRMIAPVRVWIPPLRQRKEDLHSLSILIIGKINEKLGRQIVGLDKQAAHLIEEYQWEGNFTQLEHVLEHAAELSTGLYLTRKEIAPLLSEEPEVRRFIDILPDKTLSEMEKEIIAAVFRDEGMNQVRTAARLGISRTTLWRYLQSM